MPNCRDRACSSPSNWASMAATRASGLSGASAPSSGCSTAAKAGGNRRRPHCCRYCAAPSRAPAPPAAGHPSLEQPPGARAFSAEADWQLGGGRTTSVTSSECKSCCQSEDALDLKVYGSDIAFKMTTIRLKMYQTIQMGSCSTLD